MKKNKFPGKLNRCATALLALLAGGELAHAEIAQSPLFLAQQPKPNIMFTLDDSGSMSWNCIPDSICPPDRRYPELPGSVDLEDADGNNKYTYTDRYGKPATGKNSYTAAQIAQWRSVKYNGLAYDPNVRYLPWQKDDGTYWPQGVPTNALRDPRQAGGANLIDTTEKNKDANGNIIKFLAFFYNFNPVTNKLDRVDIKPGKNYPKGADRDDCVTVADACTYEQEIQNFANWFVYYRVRIFTAIAGTSQAFNPLLGNQRVGYGQINQDATTVDGVSLPTVTMGVRDFTGAARKEFYTKLFAAQPWGAYGTPLHRAVDNVGRYFSRADDLGPWAESPGKSKGTEYSCRKSFHILMTDGYWNNLKTFTYTNGTSNADYVEGPVIKNEKTGQSYQYLPNAAENVSFRSKDADTLADVAMYFWNHDLRPDLENNVPGTTADPAFWQHITQFTVGLGVSGTLNYKGDEAALKAGTKAWPTPQSDKPTAVDDLWHAAFNGHGEYFSARNSKAFRDGLTSALEKIALQQAAASSVALNFSLSGGANAKAFVPSFESGSWIGRLQARAVTGGAISNTVVWKAEELLPAWNSRNIVTWNKDTKKALDFKWDKLSTEQKTFLANNQVLEYLRGNDALERSKPGGYMRERATKLGDIINSSPVFVQQSYAGYQFLPNSASERSSYLAFYDAKANRTPMLYAGANDGMLHAFNADTGVETFAYVPNSVYPHLKSLTEPSYTHHYMVDGQLVEGDAYSTTDSAWHTLLMGSTGAGAKSVFALDITKPTVNGANALTGANVLWEKDSADLPDLGYQLGKAAVVRMRDGSWVSIFSNGYGSGTNKSVLYIVNAFTGALIRAIDTNAGSGGANGLSTPALLFNSQREIIAAYAGDLRGNLWKFDLSANTPNDWKVALGGSPLYVAKDNTPAKAAQSIIVRPAIGFHPKGGYMINFVTGKYFEVGDGAISQLQTVYGVWDKSDITDVTPSPITGERDTILQGQTLTADTATANIGGAILTTNTVDWKTKRGWYINLTLGAGERGVGEPFITDDTTLWITTLDPVSDPCSSGGVSRLMGFDYVSGGNGTSPLFDTNGDGTVDAKDSRIAVIKTGGTVASSSTFVKPPPCGGAGQAACRPGNPGDDGGCVGSNRKVIINRLDGTTQESTIARKCSPPLRTWHEIDIGY